MWAIRFARTLSGMNPSTFTAGPRGRRVLLELAMIYDDALASAVAQRAFAIGSARGSAVWLLGWEDGAGQPAASAPEPAAIAAMIDAAPLPEDGPSAGDFEHAMGAAVGDAYYWQEPSGTDVLASAPEVRPTLRRLAAWAAPATPDHWDAPPATEQHAVLWYGASAPQADPQEWKARTLEEEARARVERPADVTANWSGTWWSFPDGLASSGDYEGVPTALDWTEDASAGAESATTALIDTTGQRILRIETASDWNTLCWDQPIEVTASKRHDWYRVTGLDTRWVIPDWAQIAAKYDAVHLSVGAYLAGANHALTVDKGINTMIAGWGPGEMRWLRSPGLGEQTEWVRDTSNLTWRERD